MKKSKHLTPRRLLSPIELAAVHGGEGTATRLTSSGQYIHSAPWNEPAPSTPAPAPSQP